MLRKEECTTSKECVIVARDMEEFVRLYNKAYRNGCTDFGPITKSHTGGEVKYITKGIRDIANLADMKLIGRIKQLLRRSYKQAMSIFDQCKWDEIIKVADISMIRNMFEDLLLLIQPTGDVHQFRRVAIIRSMVSVKLQKSRENHSLTRSEYDKLRRVSRLLHEALNGIEILNVRNGVTPDWGDLTSSYRNSLYDYIESDIRKKHKVSIDTIDFVVVTGSLPVKTIYDSDMDGEKGSEE